MRVVCVLWTPCRLLPVSPSPPPCRTGSDFTAGSGRAVPGSVPLSSAAGVEVVNGVTLNLFSVCSRLISFAHRSGRL